MRTTLAVEQVLKGPLAKDNTIDFYFYLWPEGQFPNQINPFPPVHGDRAIFFLENEQGLIRSMTDMHSPHIQINSGASPSGVVAHDGRDMAIHNEIVRLLFTPGDSLNEESFSRSISGAFSVAIDLVGFANTLPLLKTLITHNSQVVRAAACFELAGNVPGQCSCLGRFIDVKSLPAYLRNPNVIQETCKPDEWLKNQLALTMTRGSI